MAETSGEFTGYVCGLELKTGDVQAWPSIHSDQMDDWFVVTVGSEPGPDARTQRRFRLFRTHGSYRDAHRLSRKFSDGHEESILTPGCDQPDVDDTYRVRMQEIELAIVDTLRDALLHEKRVTVRYELHSVQKNLSWLEDRIVEVHLHS